MPGFNGTGPRGMGPMTGRGMGYCAVPLPGSRYVSPAVYNRGGRRDELSYLKEEARLIREQIEQIETRIKALENATNS